MSLFKGSLPVSVSEQCAGIGFYAWILPESGCTFGVICKSFCKNVFSKTAGHTRHANCSLSGLRALVPSDSCDLLSREHPLPVPHRIRLFKVDKTLMIILVHLPIMKWEEPDAERLGLSTSALRTSGRVKTKPKCCALLTIPWNVLTFPCKHSLRIIFNPCLQVHSNPHVDLTVFLDGQQAQY